LAPQSADHHIRHGKSVARLPTISLRLTSSSPTRGAAGCYDVSRKNVMARPRRRLQSRTVSKLERIARMEMLGVVHAPDRR
jgi:hypothetical protein